MHRARDLGLPVVSPPCARAPPCAARRDDTGIPADYSLPSERCVRCHQWDRHTSNALRRTTACMADRVQANLSFLSTVLTSQDLREKLLTAGHAFESVDKWLRAVHQTPGKYVDRLKDVVVGAPIHKVRVDTGCDHDWRVWGAGAPDRPPLVSRPQKCRDCISILLRILPQVGYRAAGPLCEPSLP